MAAAALLRSVARKLARAPPPPRPLLAGGGRGGGLHGGARSGSFPLPPPASNQGMATAACFRFGAGLPSLSTKLARAPSQPHHRLVLNRGVHSRTSGSSPPPTSDKDKIIEELRIRLFDAKVCIGLLSATVIGSVFYMGEKMRYERLQLLLAIKKLDVELAKKLESELRDIMPGFGDVPADVSLAQIEETFGLDMTEKKRIQADKSGETAGVKEIADLCKETIAGLKESRALVKNCHANLDRILEPAPSKPHKEG